MSTQSHFSLFDLLELPFAKLVQALGPNGEAGVFHGRQLNHNARERRARLDGRYETLDARARQGVVGEIQRRYRLKMSINHLKLKRQ